MGTGAVISLPADGPPRINPKKTGSATGFSPSISCQMRATVDLSDEAVFRKIQVTLRESLRLTF
jgi:hypothetical protein